MPSLAINWLIALLASGRGGKPSKRLRPPDHLQQALTGGEVGLFCLQVAVSERPGAQHRHLRPQPKPGVVRGV